MSGLQNAETIYSRISWRLLKAVEFVALGWTKWHRRRQWREHTGSILLAEAVAA